MKREVVRLAILIDGGVSPKVQFKNLFESSCTDRGFSFTEYPIESSGDTALYYKIEKS